MIKSAYDEKRNALIIEYSGTVTAPDMEQAFPALRELTLKCKNDFRMLADFSSLTFISPDVRNPLKKIMDFLNEKGIREIVRIIPNPENDIGFNIMSAFHYSKDVGFVTVASREEANARLSAWETKLKIGFVEIREKWQQDFVKSRLPGQSVVFFDNTIEEEIEKLRGLDILSVFVNSRVGADILERLPDLKCICTRSTGFDHIDLKTAQAKNIAVYTVPVYGENTVAEHTFALILSLSRKLKKTFIQTSQNNFNLEGLMGFDLKGKTLGVIGTGHIGLNVIRMALGFGMQVIAYDVKKQDHPSNFEYVSLENLLQNSDVITLHAPYLPSTRHMINKNNTGLIKKGAVLVNTARGGLIETEALIEALDKKIISAAALDVLEDEEYLLEDKRLLESPKDEKYFQHLQTTLKNHVLLHHENVIFTPHMAFNSQEAIQRILETTTTNIMAFSQGLSKNRVVLPGA